MQLSYLLAIALLASQASASVFARQETSSTDVATSATETAPAATETSASASETGTATEKASSSGSHTATGTGSAAASTATSPAPATGGASILPQVPAACTTQCSSLTALEQSCPASTNTTQTIACVCSKLSTLDLSTCFECLANATSPGLPADQLASAAALVNQSLTAYCAAPGSATTAPTTTGSGAIRTELVGSALLAIFGVAAALL